MKTRKNIYFKVVALAAIAIAFAMPAKAQLSDNGYANIDWQFNVPLSNNFADKASGWGMNFEGGYFVTPNLGLGLFLNYHSNHEYIPRETFKIGAGDVTTISNTQCSSCLSVLPPATNGIAVEPYNLMSVQN